MLYGLNWQVDRGKPAELYAAWTKLRGGQGNVCRTFSRLQANLITQKSVPSLSLSIAVPG
jgi:hypothetical protein